ncbi:CorA metal ion transporter [Coemansia sp. Cherry 401B]|nr:CorA metal ion transporter [Coemansia sp. RSA 2705]KAJ2717982.1 CorA metal ion transporter [Coemansia sp. Cherry 401B]
MAAIPDADRHPLPMNSTLPLFSRSVISGRLDPRALLSSRSSESSARVKRASAGADKENVTKINEELPRESPPAEEKEEEAEKADRMQAPAAVSPIPLGEESPLERRASTGSLVNAAVDEAADGLGLTGASRPPSQLVRRMGPTQYTPAAPTKKTAIARAAPGLSYMFSPTVGGSGTSSRPPSVLGTQAAAAGRPAHEPGEDTQLADMVGSDETQRPERKMYGSINVGALEQFLDEGKVPVSSSDDESGLSWEESASEASSRRASLVAQQPQLARYPSLDERSSQFSPRVRSSVGRPATPDEQAPLLGQSRQRYGSGDSERFVPADLPFHQQQQQHRRRRRRQNHEELFLDKDGFIDESYRFTFFNPSVGTIRAQEFADLRTPTMDLAALLQAGGCFWIDVLRPSFQEMHLLSKIFNIHALTVEDVMTQDAREKCEIHANYYFVCFRSFDTDANSETYLEPKCVYSVVLREGIITFHMEPAVHQYHVLRRIRRQIDHIVVTPDWLNYAIIDDITDLLAPILHRVEFDVDAIDELVLVISSSEQSDMLLRISTVRKRIMMAMRLLQGKADVVRALIKRFESATALGSAQMLPGYMYDRGGTGAGATLSSDSPRNRGSDPAQARAELPDAVLDQRKGHETVLYLGDVLDHIVTMMQNATHYDNMLGRAQTNYLAQISIELTESSNYTNDVVAKLSALAAIVVPLNFITGMWGANVKVPGQDYDDLHYFFYILGMCLLYVLIAIFWARRYRIF